MIVAAEQLNAAELAQPLPIYAVAGDEPVLVDETVATLRAAARAAGYVDRCPYVADSEFSWAALKSGADNFSLFNDRRLIELRFIDARWDTRYGQDLAAYAAHLPADTLTLLTLPKGVKKTDRNSAWFKAVDSAGAIVEVAPVPPDRLPRWIKQRLAAQRQQIEGAALALLVEHVEGNVLAAFQEIKKLGLICPAGTLEFDDVKDAVLDMARFDAFQLNEAILEGAVPRVHRIIEGLRQEGAQIPAVMGALVWQLRALLKARHALDCGASLDDALRQAKFWGRTLQLAKPRIKGLTTETLEQLLLHAAEIDRISKGMGRGDAWHELAVLCDTLALAGSKHSFRLALPVI